MLKPGDLAVVVGSGEHVTIKSVANGIDTTNGIFDEAELRQAHPTVLDTGCSPILRERSSKDTPPMIKPKIIFLGVECLYAEEARLSFLDPSYVGRVHGAHTFRVTLRPNGFCRVRVTGDGYEINEEGSSLSECEDKVRVRIRRTAATILDLADVERAYLHPPHSRRPTCKECGWPIGDTTSPAYAGCYPDYCTCPPEKRPASFESGRTPRFEVSRMDDQVNIGFDSEQWDYLADVREGLLTHMRPIMDRYLHQQATRDVLNSMKSEIQGLLLHLMDIGEIRRSGIDGTYSLESGFDARRRADGGCQQTTEGAIV